MPHRLGRPLRRRARQCSGRPRRPPTKTSIPFQPTRVPPICDAPSRRRRSITVRDPASNPWSALPLTSCLVSRRSSIALSPDASVTLSDWRSSHLPNLRDATAAWTCAKQSLSSVLPILVVPTVYPHRLHKDVCSLAPTACIRRASGLGKPSLLTHSKHRALRQRYQLQCALSHDCFVRGLHIAFNTNQPDPANEVCRWLQGGRLHAPAQDTNLKLPSACQCPSRGTLPGAGPLHRLSRRWLGTLIEWNTSEGVFSTL